MMGRIFARLNDDMRDVRMITVHDCNGIDGRS